MFKSKTTPHNLNPESTASVNQKVMGEQGLVSIIVTMVIMVILSLIVIGFAQLTRREQRQSLDRQLYSQANYAAETGINDAQKYIQRELAAGNPIPKIDVCDPSSPQSLKGRSSPTIDNRIDGPTGTISYSCAQINPQPPELIWQRIDTENSLVFPFTPKTSSSGITFAWQDSDTVPANYSGCATSVGGFAPQTGAGSWTCEAGALRIDLTPVSGFLTRASLVNNTQNFVIYPVQGGATTTTYPLAQPHGAVIEGGCTATLSAAKPRHCQVTLSGATGNYYIRIKPIYKAANIQVFSMGGGVELADAQALVDVTGKATDILKRLQVRVPISSLNSVNNTTFDYSVQSIDSFCKMYSVIPGGATPIADKAPISDTSCLAN